MTIRHSALADLPVLMDLYRESREIMLSCGDVNQWKPGYPTEEIIRDDIAKGIATACFDWCWTQIQNLRIDTHEDNVIMRHCIEKAGFRYCGVIHLLSGDPRLAFQKILP